MSVADQIRKTQLKQDKHSRKADMHEILIMVKENRLHEADERQLETLRLALELQKELDDKKPAAEPVTGLDPQQLVDAVKAAVSEIVTNLPVSTVVTSTSPVSDPSRPTMKHTSLTDFVHTGEEVSISHSEGLTESKEGPADAGDKLEKLRKLKGNG